MPILRVATVAVTLAVLPAMAFAQGATQGATATPGSVGGSVARLDGNALKPGKITYITRLMSDGQARRLGYRVFEVSPSTYEGKPAWLMVDAQHITTYVIAESLFVAKSDLTPLHLATHRPGSDAQIVFAPDSIRGTFVSDSGETRATMANVPSAVPTSYALKAMFPLLELKPDWTSTVKLLAFGPGSAVTIPVELKVAGEENAKIPDGEFPSWLVTLRVGAGEQKLWVRKSDHRVLRTATPTANMPGAYVEVILAEGQATQ